MPSALQLALSDAPALRGHIFGLTLSNNVSDATNDIDIAAGACASDATAPVIMALTAALTKRLDANWAVGTNQGGLDTGAIANNTYHIWLIQRSDTGVVDALFSLSATSPTMPANYDRKRRIGSIIRASAAIVGFKQVGDVFTRNTLATDRSSTSALSSSLFTLSIPTGIEISPMLGATIAGTGEAAMNVGSASVGSANVRIAQCGSGSADVNFIATPALISNTSAQIYLAVQIFSGGLTVGQLDTLGWIDSRGRNA